MIWANSMMSPVRSAATLSTINVTVGWFMMEVMVMMMMMLMTTEAGRGRQEAVSVSMLSSPPPMMTTMSSHLKTMTASTVKIGCRNVEMSLFWSAFLMAVRVVVVASSCMASTEAV